MTVATIGLIFFILYQFIIIKSQIYRILNILLMLIFFELFANSGKIGEISGFELQYGDFLWMVLLVFSFFIIKKRNKINRKDIIYASIFLCAMFLCMIKEFLFPFNGKGLNTRSILIFIRFLIMVLVYIVIVKKINIKEIRYIVEKVINLQKLTFIIIGFEFFIKTFLNNRVYFQILNFIFGSSENQVEWLIQRGGLASLQGLCKEPSHLAILLFILGFCDIWAINNIGKGNKIFFLNCILLFISGSFSSVLYVFLLSITYIVEIKLTTKKTISLVSIFLFSLIFLIVGSRFGLTEYYSTRLNSVAFLLENDFTTTTTSEGVRLKSVFDSLKLFLANPFLGIGIGNNISTGAMPAFLSSIGVLGIFSYIKLFGHRKYIMFPIIMMLIGSFFTMDMGIFYSLYFMIFISLYSNNLQVYKEEKLL